jgi:hypothetical protein
MDRKGGGPVRWDEFYGRTARDFYAPGSWGTHHREGNGKTVDMKVAENHTQLKRPRQFDYIYKANNDQITRARDQIANLARDQAALLEPPQKHETDQSRLWATLAWEQVKDREIALHSLCRFALKPKGPEAVVLRPVILVLRTADDVTAKGLDSVQEDQAATFQEGSQRMEAAFAALQLALADALDDSGLKPERRKEGEALKALCKDLSEQCKVIADNYANAMDRDKAQQDASKLEFRGQLQASLGQFATVARRLDDEVVSTAKSWGIEAEKGTPTPDVVAPAALRHEPRTAQVPAAPPPAEGARVRENNLLSSVDPRRDAVHGKWAITKEGIQSDVASRKQVTVRRTADTTGSMFRV